MCVAKAYLLASFYYPRDSFHPHKYEKQRKLPYPVAVSLVDFVHALFLFAEINFFSCSDHRTRSWGGSVWVSVCLGNGMGFEGGYVLKSLRVCVDVVREWGDLHVLLWYFLSV